MADQTSSKFISTRANTMANIITVARLPLLFIYLGMLYYGNQTLMLWNVLLIFIIFNLDSLDGWVARRLNEASLLGSVLDIATDRTLEYVLWVVYAHLGLIPVLVPIIVLVRGTAVLWNSQRVSCCFTHFGFCTSIQFRPMAQSRVPNWIDFHLA